MFLQSYFFSSITIMKMTVMLAPKCPYWSKLWIRHSPSIPLMLAITDFQYKFVISLPDWSAHWVWKPEEAHK